MEIVLRLLPEIIDEIIRWLSGWDHGFMSCVCRYFYENVLLIQNGDIPITRRIELFYINTFKHDLTGSGWDYFLSIARLFYEPEVSRYVERLHDKYKLRSGSYFYHRKTFLQAMIYTAPAEEGEGINHTNLEKAQEQELGKIYTRGYSSLSVENKKLLCSLDGHSCLNIVNTFLHKRMYKDAELLILDWCSTLGITHPLAVHPGDKVIFSAGYWIVILGKIINGTLDHLPQIFTEGCFRTFYSGIWPYFYEKYSHTIPDCLVFPSRDILPILPKGCVSRASNSFYLVSGLYEKLAEKCYELGLIGNQYNHWNSHHFITYSAHERYLKYTLSQFDE